MGFTIESGGAYLRDDECPECGGAIKWVRESSGSTHNAECRSCMVVWTARPVDVTFDVTSRPAKINEHGAMVCE